MATSDWQGYFLWPCVGLCPQKNLQGIRRTLCYSASPAWFTSLRAASLSIRPCA